MVSYSFLRGLGNIAQVNTRADILVEDKLRPSSAMETVDQEQELNKPQIAEVSESHSLSY